MRSDGFRSAQESLDYLEHRARDAGFTATYCGGYLSSDELGWLSRNRESALHSPALAKEHEQFLGELVEDAEGLPMYRGCHAGIAGVYELVPAYAA